MASEGIQGIKETSAVMGVMEDMESTRVEGSLAPRCRDSLSAVSLAIIATRKGTFRGIVPIASRASGPDQGDMTAAPRATPSLQELQWAPQSQPARDIEMSNSSRGEAT
jgi:hypothetical protein